MEMETKKQIGELKTYFNNYVYEISKKENLITLTAYNTKIEENFSHSTRIDLGDNEYDIIAKSIRSINVRILSKFLLNEL